MNDREDMIVAMKMMASTCQDIFSCRVCPFRLMCDCLERNGFKTVDEWEEDYLESL